MNLFDSSPSDGTSETFLSSLNHLYSSPLQCLVHLCLSPNRKLNDNWDRPDGARTNVISFDARSPRSLGESISRRTPRRTHLTPHDEPPRLSPHGRPSRLIGEGSPDVTTENTTRPQDLCSKNCGKKTPCRRNLSSSTTCHNLYKRWTLQSRHSETSDSRLSSKSPSNRKTSPNVNGRTHRCLDHRRQPLPNSSPYFTDTSH